MYLLPPIHNAHSHPALLHTHTHIGSALCGGAPARQPEMRASGARPACTALHCTPHLSLFRPSTSHAPHMQRVATHAHPHAHPAANCHPTPSLAPRLARIWRAALFPLPPHPPPPAFGLSLHPLLMLFERAGVLLMAAPLHAAMQPPPAASFALHRLLPPARRRQNSLLLPSHPLSLLSISLSARHRPVFHPPHPQSAMRLCCCQPTPAAARAVLRRLLLRSSCRPGCAAVSRVS